MTARKDAPASDSKAEDKVSDATDQVDDVVKTETEQGFRGIEVDPTPNEHYTVAGVTADKPTPESDPKLAAKVGSGKFRAV